MWVNRSLQRMYFTGNRRGKIGKFILRFFSFVILSVALESQRHEHTFSLARDSRDLAILNNLEAGEKRNLGNLYPMDNINPFSVAQSFLFSPPFFLYFNKMNRTVCLCKMYTRTRSLSLSYSYVVLGKTAVSCKITACFTLFSGLQNVNLVMRNLCVTDWLQSLLIYMER